MYVYELPKKLQKVPVKTLKNIKNLISLESCTASFRTLSFRLSNQSNQKVEPIDNPQVPLQNKYRIINLKYSKQLFSVILYAIFKRIVLSMIIVIRSVIHLKNVHLN